ncbi:MAG: hypothetical protein KTR19_08310 [Hyphomicrobiales bacterium]|nr:hypothetical protein [Hyphomicrobiales bacterium]
MVDSDEIRHKLRDVPSSDIAALALRAAMRVMPVLAKRGKAGGDPFAYWPVADRSANLLAILRCYQISIFARDLRMIDSATISTYRAATSVNRADAATTSCIRAANAAAIATARAANADTRAASTTALAAALTAFRSAGSAARAQIINAAFEADLAFLKQKRDVRALKNQPLWLDGIPPEIEKLWTQLIDDLRSLKEYYDVWVVWYQEKLEGRSMHPELEKSWVSLPEQILRSQPGEVNAYLMRLWGDYHSEDNEDETRQLKIDDERNFNQLGLQRQEMSSVGGNQEIRQQQVTEAPVQGKRLQYGGNTAFAPLPPEWPARSEHREIRHQVAEASAQGIRSQHGDYSAFGPPQEPEWWPRSDNREVTHQPAQAPAQGNRSQPGGYAAFGAPDDPEWPPQSDNREARPRPAEAPAQGSQPQYGDYSDFGPPEDAEWPPRSDNREARPRPAEAPAQGGQPQYGDYSDFGPPEDAEWPPGREVREKPSEAAAKGHQPQYGDYSDFGAPQQPELPPRSDNRALRHQPADAPAQGHQPQHGGYFPLGAPQEPEWPPRSDNRGTRQQLPEAPTQGHRHQPAGHNEFGAGRTAQLGPEPGAQETRSQAPEEAAGMAVLNQQSANSRLEMPHGEPSPGANKLAGFPEHQEPNFQFKMNGNSKAEVTASGIATPEDISELTAIRGVLIRAVDKLIALTSFSNEFSWVGSIAKDYRHSITVEQPSIDDIYGFGTWLQSAHGELKARIADNDKLDLAPGTILAIDTIIAIHGTLIESTKRGQTLLNRARSFAEKQADTAAYKLKAQEIAAIVGIAHDTAVKDAHDHLDQANDNIDQGV